MSLDAWRSQCLVLFPGERASGSVPIPIVKFPFALAASAAMSHRICMHRLQALRFVDHHRFRAIGLSGGAVQCRGDLLSKKYSLVRMCCSDIGKGEAGVGRDAQNFLVLECVLGWEQVRVMSLELTFPFLTTF